MRTHGCVSLCVCVCGYFWLRLQMWCNLLLYFSADFSFFGVGVCVHVVYSPVRADEERQSAKSSDITLSEKCWGNQSRLVVITGSSLCGCDKGIFFYSAAACLQICLGGKKSMYPHWSGFSWCCLWMSLFIQACFWQRLCFFFMLSSRLNAWSLFRAVSGIFPISHFYLFKDKLKHLLIYSEHLESVPNFVTLHFNFQTLFRHLSALCTTQSPWKGWF